jgi:hypothetical protein
MKATLGFNLPDEIYAFDSAVHGAEYRAVVINTLNMIRRRLKNKHSEEMLDLFNEIMSEVEQLPLED